MLCFSDRIRSPTCIFVAIATLSLITSHDLAEAQEQPLPLSPVSDSFDSAHADSAQKDSIDPSVSLDTVDVRTQVWPILQRHCLRCHNQQRRDGELRLDEIDEIRQGGHTGNVVLGSIEDSELLRRITSTDPGYRMPKEGAPLSPQEVDVITRWIEQGATWPENENANSGNALSSLSLSTIPDNANRAYAPKVRPKTWETWFSEQLDVTAEYQTPMRPLFFAVLVFGIFVLVTERLKRQRRDSVEDDWTKRVSYLHYLMACIVFIWIGTFLFYQVRQTRMQRSYDEIADKLQKNGIWVASLAASDNRVGPYRLKHPPRMGGTYYRGNDERNDALFNGGFYCTSKMFLSLRDRERDSLNWGDTIDEKSLAICLEIERSPFATPSLFSDKSMTSCYLRLIPEDAGESREALQVAHLQIMKEGERWRACYPLRGLATETGTLTRYKGGIDLCNATGQPHYGIRYDILVKDQRIAPESEIWMGATFLTGNVVLPQEGKILLREWFDFVPIPEITKENSKDPELLGITEHLDAEYSQDILENDPLVNDDPLSRDPSLEANQKR